MERMKRENMKKSDLCWPVRIERGIKHSNQRTEVQLWQRAKRVRERERIVERKEKQ